MNEIERYLAAAAGRGAVKVGEDITVKVDLAMGHDVTAPLALAPFEEIGVDKVFDPGKVVFILDHIYPAPTVQARQCHNAMRGFARRYGFRLFDKGEGVCHQLLSEEFALPRGAVLVGADSHTCTAGAYGVLAFGVGSTELAAAMATGTLDIEVPPTEAVILEGLPAPGVYAKDVVLRLVGVFGTNGFTDKAVIFCGSWVRQASLAEKMTISNMAIEMGAMLSYFSEDTDLGPVAATHRFDVAEFVPVLACPPSPANVRPVAELAGLPVTQVVIGSCTNGRLADMREAAAVFRAKPVHPDVNCVVLPASRRVAEAMEKEGLTDVFLQAGAVVTNPACGPCFGGHMGLVAAEDVVVSTTNRNFPGRMGAKEAKIYLASPRTAAETAAAGVIASPGTAAALGGK
ncbi:MAG: 3-isopropylmalate dehydratase/homoaconitate hydratase family large subunit [Negativicutes bacterium]|nr:3-isopropylmalate dehydratase/homoaconitate hydratase family large subunit [Negativicutes bacterium]